MIRATTPKHIFTFPETVDPFSCRQILITYKQNGRIVLELQKSDLEINGQIVSYALSQEQTRSFSPHHKASVQVRVLTPEGSALASEIEEIEIRNVLNDEVLR